MDKPDAPCSPRQPSWRRVAAEVAALAAAGGRLDPGGYACGEADPKADPPINTTTAGLAWEWMEDWLNVNEGKSGNTVPKQYRLGQFAGGKA